MNLSVMLWRKLQPGSSSDADSFVAFVPRCLYKVPSLFCTKSKQTERRPGSALLMRELQHY